MRYNGGFHLCLIFIAACLVTGMAIHKPISSWGNGLARQHRPVSHSGYLAGAGPCDHLLLENGDAILQEDGDFFICIDMDGAASPPVGYIGDDGDYNGGFDISSVEIELGNTGVAKKGFLFFRDTGIPQGSTIYEAELRITASADSADVIVNLTIVGADQDNPSRPRNSADANSRPRTTASVDWDDVDAWANNQIYTSPSICAVIQELVDRPSFAADNILLFVEDNGSTANSKRKAHSYRGTPVKSAILYVRYMNIEPVHDLSVISSQLLITKVAPDDWVGRPVLCDNGGTWIMVYRHAEQHTPVAGAALHIRFSQDEGGSWTADDTFTDGNPVVGFPISGHGANGEPADALLFVAPNGDLLLHVGENTTVGTRQGTYQYRSINDGASWTDQGQINADATLFGAQDYTTAGGTIYIAAFIDPGADMTAPFKSALYDSADNGATWSHVSDITSLVEDTNEPGIIWTGGNGLLSVLRDTAYLTTYQRTSSDLGVSWGSLVDIGYNIGVYNRPRIHQIDDRYIMVGRHYVDSGIHRTTIWQRLSGNWESSLSLHEAVIDAGYSDVLRRANGDLYLLTYQGTLLAADIYEYIVR